jgi:hypothetical protein
MIEIVETDFLLINNLRVQHKFYYPVLTFVSSRQALLKRQAMTKAELGGMKAKQLAFK